MNKVLIITYYWPPSGGAGVQRWLKFAKYLPEFGWQPHIYTPENPEAPVVDESLINDIGDNVIVIKKPIFEPYSFYKKFTGKKGNVAHGFLSEDKDSRQKLTEKLSVFIRGNFFIPDARKFWIKPSVRFLKKYIVDHNIETVITTGPPHSMHLIGMGLKKQLKIRWIADFRDPWTNIDYYKDLRLTSHADQKHHAMELEVLKTADEVIAIGKTMQAEFEEISNRKINIITNGFDANDFNSDKKPDENYFTMVHAGSINTDRNHKILWQSISELIQEDESFKKHFILKLIGKNDYSVQEEINNYMLQDCVDIISYLPHDKITDQLMEAQVLYLPLNKSLNAKGVLTGKFFEYLAANHPILCIGHPEGDVASILQQTNAGIMVDFDQKDELKNAIKLLFNNYVDKVAFTSNSIDSYSRYNLTKKLVEILR